MKKYIYLVLFLFFASMAVFPSLYAKVPVLGPAAYAVSGFASKVLTPENANEVMNRASSLIKGSTPLATTITDFLSNWKVLVFLALAAFIFFPDLAKGAVARIFGSAAKNKGITTAVVVAAIVLLVSKFAGFSSTITVAMVIVGVVVIFLTLSGPWNEMQNVAQQAVMTIVKGVPWMIALVGAITAAFGSVNFSVPNQLATAIPATTSAVGIAPVSMGYLSLVEGFGKNIGPLPSLLLLGAVGMLPLLFRWIRNIIPHNS